MRSPAETVNCSTRKGRNAPYCLETAVSSRTAVPPPVSTSRAQEPVHLIDDPARSVERVDLDLGGREITRDGAVRNHRVHHRREDSSIDTCPHQRGDDGDRHREG